MLSIALISASAEDAAKYYCQDNKLAKEDYYVTGQDPPGQWFGGKSLGLAGEVKAEDFSRLLHGESPADGSMLVHRGGMNNKHHPGWDFTFSAPKSVSIAYARSDDEMKLRILGAHDRAVKAAMDYLKDDVLTAAARRVKRENGERLELREKPKGIIAACFNHKTSRELDPQLHTHAVVLNVAERKDGTWGALKLKQAFLSKKAVGAAYRAELASILQKELGLGVERDREFFRVSAVPKGLEEDFSKRRRQILAEMERRGEAGAVSAAKATVSTRASKESFDHHLLEEAWHKEMDRDGFTQLRFKEVNHAAMRESRVALGKDLSQDRDLLSGAIQGLTEHTSTFSKEQVAQRAFEAGQCHKSVHEIRQDLANLDHHGEILKLRRADSKELYTTKAMVKVEETMLSDAVGLSKAKSHGIDQAPARLFLREYEEAKSRELGRKAELTPDQRRAVEYALGSGRLAAIEGVAGSGKSFAMGAVKHAYERAGFTVRGFAPTGIAAQNLAESGIESMTLDRYFRNSEDRLTSKDVVVCDEMGMVGSLKTARLLAEVRAAGAKVILVGESEQHQPIDAGGAFKAITRAVEKESITKIFRQNEAWQREAVELFRSGDAAEALNLYVKHGALRVAESEPSLKKAIVEEYVAYHNHSAGKSQVVLSRNNADVSDLNQQIRAALQEKGYLGRQEHAATIENRLGRVEKSFSVGDKIVFLKNDAELGVKNGTLAEVVRVIPDAKGGARLLQVKEKDRAVTVDLFSYDKLDHAYALTIHKAQGSTVDRVLVHGTPNLDRESAYVANSRQKESVLLFCSLAQFGKDLSMNYEPLFRKKEEVLKEEIKPEVSKAFAKSVQKDTTLDYEILEPLATKRLKELGERLTGQMNKEQIRIVHEIATTQGAAKSLLGDPSPAPWLENAREILKSSSYGKANDLKTYIASLKIGHAPSETTRFTARKSDLEKSVHPFVARQLEQIEAVEDKQSKKKTPSKDRRCKIDGGLGL